MRGLSLSAEQRERIATCRDLNQLSLWLRRAATVSSSDEVFAEDPLRASRRDEVVQHPVQSIRVAVHACTNSVHSCTYAVQRFTNRLQPCTNASAAFRNESTPSQQNKTVASWHRGDL